MMPQIPEEIFMNGLKKLLEIDEKWVPSADDHSLYIRPFMFASSEFIAARQSDDYTFCILTSPVGPYYSGTVKVKIEEEYTRATGGGIGYTKAAGNYGGAFYPTAQAIKEGYNQVVWTDHKDHKFIEESGTMNLMLLVGDTFLTPPLTDRILAGVTRRSIITLVKERGWNIEERPISVDEIVEAARTGNLKEAFGMGTAAVVSQIDTIGHQGTNYSIPAPKDGRAMEIKKMLNDIRLGLVEDTHNWMMDIEIAQPA